VPGHQVVGQVVEIGEDVRGWSPLDRAGVTWLGWADGTCGYCRYGRENLCPQARFTGWDIDGGFATSLVVMAGFAHRLPDRMTGRARS
jgi:propanol-preferring alcohol dehydrogenase